MKIILKNTLLVLAGLASASVMAQTGGESAVRTLDLPPPAPMSELAPRTENGITYMCGGVGEDEVQAMKQAASDYDLMLTFAAANGAYLADVNVDIANARGRSVLQAKCDAPIMLVNFEQGGNYRVSAEANGHTVTRTAQVRSGGRVQSVALAWPMRTVDVGMAPVTRGGGGTTGGTEAGSR